MSKLRFMVYTFLAVAAGGALSLAVTNRFDKSLPKSTAGQLQMSAKKGMLMSRAHLYFADKEKPYLTAEQRDLLHEDNTVSFARTIVTALVEGPRQDFARTLSPGTVLRALFIDQNKTAYVDLSGSIKESCPGGSQTEILTVYAIVNSLILTIPEIETVKIMIDGREAATLCGHMDLRFPMKANMLLVR
jgi:spore germination protein GerM